MDIYVGYKRRCGILIVSHLQSHANCMGNYTGWLKKIKPLPNYQKSVLNRIKVCQWD